MPKKILVIDDSALMRRKLTAILEEGGKYEVRTARDGKDGLELAKSWLPDAITLDINMPVMDGITCLSLIMEEAPRPVVMVSSLTERGAIATFEALELGAVDYVAKPGGTVSVNLDDVAEEIRQKVAGAVNAKVKPGAKTRKVKTPAKAAKPFTKKALLEGSGVVVIGVSTGGPSTLEQVLTTLPADFPLPVLVAQHMPSRFTKVFAERLDTICQLKVTHVDKPTVISPGVAYIARGDADMVVARRAGKLMAISVPEGKDLWHPSVSRLVESVRQNFQPSSVIGVMLTGMGSDGAEQMTMIKKQGGRTIAESETTAVVYGMPRELVDRGGATLTSPSYEVSQHLLNWVRQR